MTVRCQTCAQPLAGEPRFCPSCGAPVPQAASREARKTVTVLFADIADSTALGEKLDPEAVRALLTRHFAVAREILERHGATVEKFIGDAVMSVFGIPELHEDDALRAVRAAVQLRDGIAALGGGAAVPIRLRIGVNTGDVVAGDPERGETLVTGDAVNVAARLEQAAAVGEVLIGPLTYQMVRDAVTAEAAEPLQLKGKAEAIVAHRVISVDGPMGRRRNLGVSLVGREAELERLQAAWAETRVGTTFRTVTVMAAAGVGKSRLVRELTESAGAQTLKGRCLPYGDGITYWPIREMVLAAAGISETDSGETARRAIEQLVSADPNAALLVRRLGSAIGTGEDSAPQEEIFWAIRRTLELLAGQGPLLLSLEDIHWAEPTLLDLLDYLGDMTSGPILLVATARPELLDERPGWGTGSNRQLLRLETLGADASEALLLGQRGGLAIPLELRRRILEASEGNPLFVEEMVAMLREGGGLSQIDGTWQAEPGLAEFEVPPTVRALLAARLDRLPSEERTLTSRAAVVGRSFEAAALSELAPAPLKSDLGRRLLSLVRKELLRPDQGNLSLGDAFRFRHVLIRDAAYAMLSRAERAELHERFAEWLEATAGERIGEFVEVVGFHFEQAALQRRALGDADQLAVALERKAAGHLRSAGRAARNREDIHAAVSLLERAVRLAPGADPERAWDLMYLTGLVGTLGELERAATLEAELDELVPTLSDRPIGRRWRLRQAAARQWRAEPGALQDLEAVAREVYSEAELEDDLVNMALALECIGSVAVQAGRSLEELDLLRQALELAERSRDMGVVRRMRSLIANRLQFAPIPRREAEAEALRMLAVEDQPSVRTLLLNTVAVLAALDLRLEEAHGLLADSRRLAVDLGEVMPFLVADWPAALCRVAWLQGDFAGAEDVLRPCLPTLEAADDAWHLTSLAAMLARTIALQPDRLNSERQAEVERLAQRSRETAVPEDALVQANWRQPLALLASFKSQHEEAVRLAREMTDLIRDAQAPEDEVDVFLDATVVYQAAGRREDAQVAAAWARTVAENRGSGAHLQIVGRLLEAL